LIHWFAKNTRARNGILSFKLLIRGPQPGVSRQYNQFPPHPGPLPLAFIITHNLAEESHESRRDSATKPRVARDQPSRYASVRQASYPGMRDRQFLSTSNEVAPDRGLT
jgi:hypothetical protein